MKNSSVQHSSSHQNSTTECVVAEESMKKFVSDCVRAALQKSNSIEEVNSLYARDSTIADQLADLLIEADLRGHYSHGLNRLNVYLEELERCVGQSTIQGGPRILKRKGGTAWVDGANNLGVVASNFCTELVIQLAKEFGIGWVTVKNSNHFGICAHYAKKMAAHGLVGMTFTNASPILFICRSAEMSLGSNPICCVANGSKEQFALDMATSTVAFGKVEYAHRKGQNEVPKYWGADGLGNETTDPTRILNGGGCLPIGSSGGYAPESLSNIEDASYKGSGLAMMVELFCGVLSGSNVGKAIRRWRNFSDGEIANVGQCFVAIDPDCFAPNFADRLQNMLDETHNLRPADPERPVLIPGDPEKAHIEQCAEAGGIIYDLSIVRNLENLAEQYNVPIFTYNDLPDKAHN